MTDSFQASGTNTTLNLLTRDGAIEVKFSATLTPTQYEEVYDCVSGVEEPQAMCRCIRAVAEKWGIEIMIERLV
jgi:hypothetical protein